MFYVFQVDVGRMLSFDMQVAFSNVENLKATIERVHGIPAANIVLLVSGGEFLANSAQVSCFSGGTDTNPIYMFLVGDLNKVPPIPPTYGNKQELDLTEQVERCRKLPPTYETIVARAQLALKMYDLAKEEEALCENLIHEQHLQQQGWSAVIANLEDLTSEFQKRVHHFRLLFDKHFENRSNYLEILHNFEDDIAKLSRIPILPGLLPLAEADFHGFDYYLSYHEEHSRSPAQQGSEIETGKVTSNEKVTSNDAENAENAGTTNTEVGGDSADKKSNTSPHKKLKMGDENSFANVNISVTDDNPKDDVPETTAMAMQTSTASTTSSSARRPTRSLLHWITSKEHNDILKILATECVQGLATFNASMYAGLKDEIAKITKICEGSDVKEIKGLGERLCLLEEFKYKIRKMVQDQKDLMTAIQQNQNRANDLRDPSVLPDLCASHESQLGVMLQNHIKTRELRRCVVKAKDELGGNVSARLNRIVCIENTLNDIDNKLLFYHRCIRRAERHIQIIEQIHQAPCIYMAAVAEVVRRKIFSGKFTTWASRLAEEFDSIHSEEIKRRQLFNESFQGHFLNILFPGMNDMPPAFANELPILFDTRLPNLTKQDLDILSLQLPELAAQFQLPDMQPVINFFISHSIDQQTQCAKELLLKKLTEELSNKPDQNESSKEMLSEGKEEIETEFENVAAVTDVALTKADATTSMNDDKEMTVARSTNTEQTVMQSAETLTDENDASIRAEVLRLRGVLGALSKLAMDCISLARINLNAFKSNVEDCQSNLQSELQLINEKWNVLRLQSEEEKLRHEKELQMLQELLHQRNIELKNSIEESNVAKSLKLNIATLEAQIEELRSQLKNAQTEKDIAVADAREELIHEHKTELESLRCRFKLMTSIELSPSETSLEKIERPNSAQQNAMIDLEQHEAIIAQLRATKDKAINEAMLDAERANANLAIYKQLLDEKKQLLEQARERESINTAENLKLKMRLDALSNEEESSWLREKIEYLNRDKRQLEDKLRQEKSKRMEMESSFAALRCSTHEQTSSGVHIKSSGSSQKYIVLESCTKGDIVLVVWSVRHGQYMVVQDSPSLYFVHESCLPALGLRLPTAPSAAQIDEVSTSEAGISALPTGIPMPYYAIGRVTVKEYCQAKKDDNRYHVTKGSKFYRIKLAPLTTKTSRRERINSFTSSVSHSVSQCESYSEAAAAVAAGSSATANVSGSILTNTLRPSISLGNATSADVTDFPSHSKSVLSTADMTPIPMCSETQNIDVDVDVEKTDDTTILASGNECKKRTISIASVTEEEDNPGLYYINSDEEECNETANNTLGPDTNITISSSAPHLKQSVITEQPTSSHHLKMDLLFNPCEGEEAFTVEHSKYEQCTSVLMSNENSPMIQLATSVVPDIIDSCPSSEVVTTTDSTPFLLSKSAGADNITSTNIDKNDIIEEPISSDFLPLMLPSSIATMSEDSDEYRSLEGKDDGEDFPISE